MVFARLMRIIKTSENRRERRVKVRFTAELGGLTGRVTDISLGGLGFYPDDPGLEVGDEVMAHLSPDDSISVDIPARVVGADAEGMVLCVAFLTVDEAAFDALEQIILHQTAG